MVKNMTFELWLTNCCEKYSPKTYQLSMPVEDKLYKFYGEVLSVAYDVPDGTIKMSKENANVIVGNFNTYWRSF